jgi:hypothetical protein
MLLGLAERLCLEGVELVGIGLGFVLHYLFW